MHDQAAAGPSDSCSVSANKCLCMASHMACWPWQNMQVNVQLKGASMHLLAV